MRKKFIYWLINLLNVDIVTEKVVIKEVVKEILVSLNENEIINGSLTIKGNLLVTGSLNVTAGLTCLKINESNKNK